MSTYLDLDGNVRSGTEYPNPDSYSPDWMSDELDPETYRAYAMDQGLDARNMSEAEQIFYAGLHDARNYPHADILSPGPNRSRRPGGVFAGFFLVLAIELPAVGLAWIVWHFWPIIAAWVRK